MIETLLALILIFEIVRLYLYIQDSRRINKLNTDGRERSIKMDKEWQLLRKAELEELTALAKGSDTLRQIMIDLMELQKEKK